MRLPILREITAKDGKLWKSTGCSGYAVTRAADRALSLVF